MQPRQILVTYALPYANGPLHLGHLTGLIQTDIWVRFQRMQGAQCIFVCGCDSHGTPIMIQAEKSGMSPETLTETIRASHIEDLRHFGVNVDNYHTTHSPENQQLSELVFNRHEAQGNIIRATIQQAYDPEKNMFLPDRLIRGECPRCHAPDQYGDNCEVCGATYSPTDLIQPRSTLSGATPVEKASLHYFFRLTHYETFLRNWTRAGHLQEEVTHKLDEWFSAGLKDWDISRDAPYFGFLIPEEKEKYFYCWLDAPIGYMASLKNLCARRPDIDFDFYWQKDSPTELYHFIGKDIIYFHALFWPAVLEGAGFRTPTAIFTHGFLTVDGQKMSKSRGTFILASQFREHLPPEYLRYFLASRLTRRIEDLDIAFDDFIQRINSDIVGKFVNIASRSARFIHANFNDRLSDTLADPALFEAGSAAGDRIAALYESLDYSQAIREIMTLADHANQYIDTQKPWVLMRDPEKQAEAHAICSMGIQLFRQLVIYLKPVLPEIAEKAEAFLKTGPLQWTDKNRPLPPQHILSPFEPLAQRVDPKQVDALKSERKADCPH